MLDWFEAHGRRFAWRETDEPYRVLIAELLLQRTRADLVEPLYRRFVATYPDPWALAAADPEGVSDLLRPLGFAHRTARLTLLGRALVERHGGRVPGERAELLALPGVGPYVANAVRVVAFGERESLLDPNIIRLIGRVFGVRSARARPRDDPALWTLIRSLLPRSRAREFNLALVDLGATVCRARRPRCFACPLRARCRAFAAGEVTPAEYLRPCPEERLARQRAASYAPPRPGKSRGKRQRAERSTPPRPPREGEGSQDPA